MSQEDRALTLIAQPQLTPGVWQMIEAIAVAAHESRKVGVSTRGEAALKFLFCYENGLALSAANTGLYIVNGRIAAQSNIIAAQIRKHPDYDYRIKALDDSGCTIEIMRRDHAAGNWKIEGEASFTEADAKRAGLAGKDNYVGYPSDMYFNRALARAQRRYAPDVFSQPVYTPEEMGMATDGEGNVIECSWRVTPEPQLPPAQGAPVVAETPVAPPQVQGPTLDDLMQHYSAEMIIVANEGKIPGTDAELAAVAAKLAATDG